MTDQPGTDPAQTVETTNLFVSGVSLFRGDRQQKKRIGRNSLPKIPILTTEKGGPIPVEDQILAIRGNEPRKTFPRDCKVDLGGDCGCEPTDRPVVAIAP